MHHPYRSWLLAALIVTTTGTATVAAQRAHASEAPMAIPTYPFSEPNPIPILTTDSRLYPYHSFEGYSAKSVSKSWKVVTLENDFIKVEILPQVGGKVFGATVKSTGRHFIYQNDALKFRNIALRGPWTSGGIEFNFGVIGHAPSTATPVDYLFRDNRDGSASCIIGMMDLPSRTKWRVEIRLPADRAAFETRVHWYNPTTNEAPYYTWMTAAASARPDLWMTIPGDTYLGHPGDAHPWPIDSAGRNLSHYAENDFGGNKSYHVVGARSDFFGGYYHDADWGFVHAAPQGDLPGRKLWIWSLSRQGGIWKRLLTDQAGQYVEYQAGRELVQYSPSGEVNPIKQVGFDPGGSDRWTDTWFPVEQLGGLTDASANGAIYARVEGDSLRVTVTATGVASDTLAIHIGDGEPYRFPLTLEPLRSVTRVVRLPAGTEYQISLHRLGIDYHSDPAASHQDRPWTTDPASRRGTPAVDRAVVAARQLALGRRYPAARKAFEAILSDQPWQRDALLGMARLEYRRGNYEAGLADARKLLQLDTYDADANFAAGNLFRALGRNGDATDAFDWAARSLQYRVAANVELAELALASGNLDRAFALAERVLDNDRANISAFEIKEMITRERGNDPIANGIGDAILRIDPLDHFVAAERYLAAPTPARADSFLATMQGEYPDQTILELAIGFHRRGATDKASALLGRFGQGPVSSAWRAWLDRDATLLPKKAAPAFAIPYRRESIAVLRWAVANRSDWSWRYLLALNLWGRDRPTEAAAQMDSLGVIDWAPAVATRALLLNIIRQTDPTTELMRAVAMAPRNRIVRVALIDRLRGEGRWQDALRASSTGRRLFPGDFTLAILHAANLLDLGQPDSTLAVLRATEVLPSEHSRGIHQLYVNAHLTAALNAIDSLRYDQARSHLAGAREWPENLGEGRLYDPDERMIDYLSGVVALREHDPEAARRHWQAVADHGGGGVQRFLVMAARARLAGDSPPVRSITLGNDRTSSLIRRILEITP